MAFVTEAVHSSPFSQAAPNLAALGFTAIPLIPADAKHNGRGKAPGEYRGGAWQGMSRWQRFRDTGPSAFELGLWDKAPGANVGILCGTQAAPDLHVVAVDLDATDPDALDTLMSATPVSPMVKRGHKGETRFFLAPRTLKTRSYDGPDGRLVDLLTGFDTRQTVCPPSVHPKTGKAYVWTKGPVAARDLPVLTEDDLQVLEEALESCGWERGGRQRAEKRINAEYAENRIDPDDLWSETKAAAMSRLSDWVPALGLYDLRPARGGYECVESWRPSSSGRPLHERKRNLSIQPNGIKDWGSNNTYSAIDLVMAARDCDQEAATEWLRGQLGLGDDGAVVIALGVSDGSVVGTARAEDTPCIPQDRRTGDAGNVPQPAGGPTHTPSQLPAELLSVPGLVGEIADWICDTARQPQRLGAMLAAIEVVGTAAGRTFSGPTKTGTHLYGLFLAPSGASKDHPLKCIDRLLRASTMGPHVGPGEYMSMSALVKTLARQPLTISAIDEFGAYLARINGPGSSPHEKAITRTLRTAWGSSFDTMATPEWAQLPSVPIFSPALSIYGVSTHEAFFRSLDGDDVFNGFLNRFVIFSTMEFVEEVEPALDKTIVPESLSQRLVDIYNAAPAMVRATSHNGQSDGPLIVVPWADEAAHSAYMTYRQTCMRREQDAVFYARSAEIAQRLATIRAIGMSASAPALSLEDIRWGIALADTSARETVAMAQDYMSENPFQANVRRVLRAVRAKADGIGHSDLVRAMQHGLRARELAEVVTSLEEAGEIVVSLGPRPAGGGKAPKTYTAVDVQGR